MRYRGRHVGLARKIAVRAKERDSQMTSDFLDELIAERTDRNPVFPQLVGAALEKRRLLRELAARREQLGLTQVAVAKRMGTSQSGVARLEAGEIDAKLSTLDRYAGAMGFCIEWQLKPISVDPRPTQKVTVER
jgi:DNA-binding XRE family transcriptional regulator